MPQPKRNDRKRVVGYVRVSTDEQHLGPDAQRAALTRWCEANGAELVCVAEDLAVSGGAELDKRPGLLAAIDALRPSDAGVLLVARRDRLARDVVIAAMVERLAERAGASVMAADGSGNGDSPEAGLMRTIIDAFAQYERQLIRARTKAALAVKRGRGERIGAIPVGFRLLDGAPTLEVDPAEQAAVDRAKHLRAQHVPIRAIAEKLNAEGHSPRGVRWHPTTVARILGRE